MSSQYSYHPHPPQPQAQHLPPGYVQQPQQKPSGYGAQVQQPIPGQFLPPTMYMSQPVHELSPPHPQQQYYQYQSPERGYSPSSGSRAGNGGARGLDLVNLDSGGDELRYGNVSGCGYRNANVNGMNSTRDISPIHKQQQQQHFQSAQASVQQASPGTSSSQNSLCSTGSAPSSLSSVPPQDHRQSYQQGTVPAQVQQGTKPYTSPYNSDGGAPSSQLQFNNIGNGGCGGGAGSMSRIPPQRQGQYYQQGQRSQQRSPAGPSQVLAVNASAFESTSNVSPAYHMQYNQHFKQVPTVGAGHILPVDGGGPMSSTSPQHGQQYFQQLRQALPSSTDQALHTTGYGNVSGTRSMSSSSPEHGQIYFKQVRQDLGPPPAFALAPPNGVRSMNGYSLLDQKQVQYQSIYQQPQAQVRGQGLVAKDKLCANNSQDVFIEVKAEVDEQTQHLWYWIEIIKLWTFHDAYLSRAEASRLATLYISNLPSDLPIHNNLTDAHTSIVSTLLSESLSLLRHLILTVLFPLIHSWTFHPSYHTHMSQCKTQPNSNSNSHSYTQTRSRVSTTTQGTSPRTHRLNYWRDKALQRTTFPDGSTSTPLEKFIEVLDTILDRKWVYGATDGGDRRVRAARTKIQGYFLWKFAMSADVVFLELVGRLLFNGERYCAERWREVYFPAMIPKLMAINQDPLILPYLVAPDNWPCTMRIDEDVLHCCLAIMGAGQQ